MKQDFGSSLPCLPWIPHTCSWYTCIVLKSCGILCLENYVFVLIPTLAIYFRELNIRDFTEVIEINIIINTVGYQYLHFKLVVKHLRSFVVIVVSFNKLWEESGYFL